MDEVDVHIPEKQATQQAVPEINANQEVARILSTKQNTPGVAEVSELLSSESAYFTQGEKASITAKMAKELQVAGKRISEDPVELGKMYKAMLLERMEQRRRIKPIGEVVVGTTDPRTLSREAFESSPDLLFHGASEPFNFTQDFNYSYAETPHSRTVGNGFYTTPQREDARYFSLAFGRNEGEEVVEAVLPYQARMFDFREEGDQSVNAPVPQDLVAEYASFIEQDVQKRFPSPPTDISQMLNYSYNREYLELLKGYVMNQDPIDLREMLSLKGNEHASEFVSSSFPEFMRSKGFDGIAFIEGGDHPSQKDPVSYVFYNLEKIGTYKAWHQDTEE